MVVVVVVVAVVVAVVVVVSIVVEVVASKCGFCVLLKMWTSFGTR